METVQQSRIYVASILSTRQEVLISEDDERETVTTRTDVRHCPLIAGTDTEDDARAFALHAAETALPSADEWKHQVKVIPFVLTITATQTGDRSVSLNIVITTERDAQDIDSET